MPSHKRRCKCAICGTATSRRWYLLSNDLKPFVKYKTRKICELDYKRIRRLDVPIVSRSTIIHAGNGLFADRDYKWNEIITYYDGKAYSLDDPKLPEDRSYFKRCGKYLIDGRVHFGGSLGRYINCPPRGTKANTRWGFSDVGTRIAIRAAKKPHRCKNPIAIKTGEEFFICYGPGYWAAIRKRKRKRKKLMKK